MAAGIGVGELDAGPVLRRRCRSRCGSSNLAHAIDAAETHARIRRPGMADADLLVGAEDGRTSHLRADGGQIDDRGGIAVELHLDALAARGSAARGACRASRAAAAPPRWPPDAAGCGCGGGCVASRLRPRASTAAGFTTWRE